MVNYFRELLPAFAFRRCDPDLLRGGGAQGDSPSVGIQRQGMVVVLPRNADVRAGADPALLEKLQQTPVTFVNAADHITAARLGVGEQQQAPAAATAGALQFAEIAVGASASAAQFGQ